MDEIDKHVNQEKLANCFIGMVNASNTDSHDPPALITTLSHHKSLILF